MAICLQCSTDFELSHLERDFLKRVRPVFGGKPVDLPEPKLCTDCRRQRRYAFRNDRKLYKRTCDKTGKTIISLYSPDKKNPVYAQDVWWSDAYDPKEYGRDFDFNRPFFEQFAELQKVVPRPASVVVNSENCDYTGFTLKSRNCYLTSRLADSEDIYYSYLIMNSKDCFDCYNIDEGELLYECIDCGKCYRCFFTERCRGCNDLWFCADMSGCSDCFGCVGLVQKKHHFFNYSLRKEAYESRVREWFDGTWENLQKCLVAFREHKGKFPVRALNIFNSENAHGSYIFESKNVWNSFDMVHCEDVLDSTHSEYCKDAMDIDMAYHVEMSYEVIATGRSMNNLFVFGLINGNYNVFYSMDVYNNAHDVFGCIGMKGGTYCILNKAYSEKEYEKMVQQIIEHMQKTGEWGEFFPAGLSAHGYNETVAQDLIPLSKEKVLNKGWKWHDEDVSVAAEAKGENIVKCEVTGRAFRLIPKELEFYKKMGLPLPRRHPDQRHKDRLSLRNPYRLRKDKCSKCGKQVSTDQSPEKIIYCEACYLATVY